MNEQWRFLLSRRWVTWAAVVVLFAIACHFLAQWQFARRAAARAEITRVENNYNAVPRPIDQVLDSLDAFSIDQKWLPVQLTGEYLTDQEVLVRNRPCGGVSGYDVLTPFRLTSGEVFFVDRGCTAGGSVVNSAGEFAPAPQGEVTVAARLRASEPSVPGRSDAGNTVGSIDLDSLTERVGLPAFTGAYGQLVGGDLTQAPYPAPTPVPDEGPHLSYALQWYVFAGIAFVAYGWAANQERRNRASDAADTLDAEGVAASSEAAEPVRAATTAAGLSERYGVSGAGGRKATPLPKRTARQKSDAELEDELLDQQS